MNYATWAANSTAYRAYTEASQRCADAFATKEEETVYNITVYSNRTTNHLSGLEIRTIGGGNESGGDISYYAESHCGALSRGQYRMSTGPTVHTLEEARKLLTYRLKKGCNTCSKALAAMEAVA